MKNNEKKNVIPVFFSIDDNYAPYLATALNSAIRNSSPEKNYKAIILYKDLATEHIKRISSMTTENFEIDFMPMTTSFDSITDRIGNCLRADYFTLTIYFRLFIPEMFPQYDKGIYLDSDIVVLEDLDRLFEIPLENELMGAVPDYSVVDVPPLAKYIEEAVGINRHRYINSGILLMNLKAMREAKISEKFLYLLNKYQFDCIAPDQDYLNAMCRDRILYLPGDWDAMPNPDKATLENPKIVHYNLFAKPWCYDNVQYEEYFWKYAVGSGYYEEILAFKAGYSQEQKDSDSECLELLMSRGAAIAETEGTMKSVFESGKEKRL